MSSTIILLVCSSYHKVSSGCIQGIPCLKCCKLQHLTFTMKKMGVLHGLKLWHEA
jgi:hypothetical protein